MHKESPRPFPSTLLALGFLALLIGFGFLLFRSAPGKTTDVTKEAPLLPETQRLSGYHNRAVLSDPVASAAPGATRPAQPTISGNVYDSDGLSLSDAVVVATTFELAGNLPSVAATVKTDRGGHFELLLTEGTYQVNARLEGHGPASATVRTGDVVSLVLPQSGVVTGHVYDEHHSPIKSFVLDVISVVPGHMPAPAPLWSKAFDSPDGSFRADQLPAWAVVLRAHAQGYAPALSPSITVAAKETRDLELTLQIGCALSGRVEDKSGAPAAYVLLDAESRLVSGTASELSVQTANQVQSDTDGRFRLEHVPLGTVLVRAYDGAHAVTTATIEVTRCDQLAPAKIVLSTGGSVSGIAKTSDGKPIVNATLSLSHRSIGFVAARSNAEGHFRFERISPGSARLELHYQGQRTLASVSVKEGQDVVQDMVLFGRGTGEIRGRVTAGGRPLSGARLLVASGHGNAGVDTFYPVTDASGSYRLAGVGEGLYLVSVISTTQGKGVKVAAGGVMTVDLDVTPPKEAVKNDDKDDEADEPAASPAATPASAATAAPASAPAPGPAATAAPAPADPASSSGPSNP